MALGTAKIMSDLAKEAELVHAALYVLVKRSEGRHSLSSPPTHEDCEYIRALSLAQNVLETSPFEVTETHEEFMRHTD